MNLQQNNCKPLFKMQGKLTCLHSEFLVTGSLGVGSALVVCHEEDWRSFISISGEQRCLEEGYRIFQSDTEYKRYSEDFRAYIKHAEEYIIPKFTQLEKEITENELTELMPLLAKFWYYYGITEFSYHELAYQKSQEKENRTLSSNLKDLEGLKFDGRKILNAFVFEEGVLMTVLKGIGKQFLENEDDALFLYSEELISLYQGNKIDQEIIEERKKYYAVASEKDSSKIFFPQEAKELWKIFCEIDTKEEIRGIVAFPGHVSGKVVVAPMLVDINKVKEIDARMSPGDILVAESTTPELLMLCKKASAIVTDQGGMLSHAAIVARESKVPCIIGTGNATHKLRDGDLVEVDADAGIVRILEKAL